jgi:zinc D-Ala-D-Ala carboxypeptidase
MHDDIPEAFRQPVSEASSPRANPIVWVGSILGLAAVALGGWFALSVLNTTPSESASEVVLPATPSPVPLTKPETTDDLLGHLPYEEAPLQELKPISTDGRLQLRGPAAQAYRRMEASAKAAGVRLQPISAFRTVKEQNYLFFKVKEQRAQATAQRADVSAPPGHSEHHTGYAIDVSDAARPATNLNQSFEQTPTFKWLTANAARFSFELSFPKNNLQGVSYEPWHWRYVGDQPSLKTFYSARNLKATQGESP